MDYYKYLPVSLDDVNWGLYVLNTGCTKIKGDNLYPNQYHPEKYNFSWSKGRILNEYQIIYITNGRGVFESESSGHYDIEAGTIIILFPGDRHRYRPDKKTGWVEHWIGIKGEFMDSLVARGYFKAQTPCFYIGFKEEVLNLFYYIIEHTKQEKAGYQPLIAGAASHLLGSFHYIQKQQHLPSGRNQMVVDQAKLIFRSKIDLDFSPEEAASELGMGYSMFRKVFKNYTGISPGQYFIQLKIERAKELLHDPNKTVKEVAYELRFTTCFYFSKIFKEKTGFTPTGYRQRIFEA